VRAATTAGSPRRRSAAALAFAALAAGITAIGMSIPADAAKTTVLGKTKSSPKPACPKNTNSNPCEAIGSVTGFQMRANGKKRIFEAKKNGKLVAWSVDMSRPTKKPKGGQQGFFADLFGNNNHGNGPTARIAIIRRVSGKVYKLKKESPVQKVDKLLGREQFFTLTDPLRIRRGDILALTTPTWLPAFTPSVPNDENRWRSSRAKGKCTSRADIVAGKPHQKLDTKRKYGCDYKGARLLYWGYYVPD
jgi:hypothetical protein